MPIKAKDFFDQHGFIVSPTGYDQLSLKRIIENFDAVIAGQYETGRAPHGVNRFGEVMVKVANAWWANRAIQHVVTDPGIARMAAELLGVEELYLWADSLYWKAPQFSGTEQAKIGWHQDRQYWGMSSTDQMITACVTLQDADDEHGGLHFADGSHKWGLVGGSDAITGSNNEEAHGEPLVPEGQEWKDVCPRVSKGCISFHHCHTFHRSGPNQSQEPRRSITIHMVSGEGRLLRPFDEHGYGAIQVGEPFRGEQFFPKLWPNLSL